MSDAPAKDEKPAAAAAAAAVEEQKAEAADKKADDKAEDKADAKEEKKSKGKGKGKKAAAAAAAGDKPKKKTLAQQRAEAETLVEDPKKDLGAPAEVLKEGAKRLADNKPKPPAQYTPQDWKAKTKEVTIPKGKGTKIEDCENVLKAVNKLKGDDASLKGLHALMFGAVGEAKKRKSHIREFSGFDADTVDEVKVKKLASLNQKKVDALKQYAAILDLEVSGAKSELAERIVDFLAKPKPSGKPYKSLAGAKRKSRSKSTKKSKSDKEKTPRGPSAYILFANAKRAEVTEKYPDKKMTEVAKVLGEMWGDLSETKKNEWKAKAKAAKPGDGKAKSKSKSKSKSKDKKKSKKSKKDESDDESGSESGSDDEGSGSDSDAKPMSDDDDDKKKKKKEKAKKEKPAKKEKKDKKDKKEKKASKKEKAESDDEEAPKKKKQKVEKSDKPDDKIKAATKKAVMEGDDKMSVKTVLESLKQRFGEDTITEHKPTIKQWINDFFTEKTEKAKDK